MEKMVSILESPFTSIRLFGVEAIYNFLKHKIKKNFEFLKSGNKSTKPKYKWNSGFHSEKKDLQQAHIVFGVEGVSNLDKQRLDLSAL